MKVNTETISLPYCYQVHDKLLLDEAVSVILPCLSALICTCVASSLCKLAFLFASVCCRVSNYGLQKAIMIVLLCSDAQHPSVYWLQEFVCGRVATELNVEY